MTLVTPVPPGSGSDVVARIVGRGLSERLGRSIIVTNRDGADGMIGAGLVAQAKPDGYTLLVTAGGQAILPSVEPSLPFDVVNDFEPVALLTSSPLVLVAKKDFPANSVPELVAYAKSHPRSVTYGNTGIGTVPTLAMRKVASAGGIDLVPIGYRGGAPAMIDVAAGTINLYFATISAAVPLIRTGKVKVLGISTAKVPAFVQGIPGVAGVEPVANQGFPGFDLGITYGIFAPAKTPRDVIQRLEAAIGETLNEPAIREALNRNGAEPTYMNADDYGRYFKSEIETWRKIVGP